ncbi:MAG: MATE family efflux transporter [Firmicutes bacterium]|nr:MATE family efflux transporter [Bacillota bacterium]NBI62853.1 MATE family efflux transporter [Clostridiales bacterium]
MEYRFSNQDLRKLIIPLIIEQFLQISVGLVDSVMVASVGEAAVSGVSLVDSVFILFINVFSALATGGAVVAGQYIGRKDAETGCRAAWQMLLFVGALSILVMAACYVFRDFILYQVFGDIDAEVRHNSKVFLLIVSASIPFIALYNAGAAIFRVMGNSKIAMQMSLLMNGINLVGIAILIYGFHFGVAGAGIPTLVARVAAAVIIIVLLCDQKRLLHLPRPFIFHVDKMLLKRILYIGVPNGLENSMFQLGKILVLSLVSSFGTAAIAANAIGNYVAMFAILPGIALGYTTITVVSQCVGAGDYQQVRYYTKKLIKLCYLSMLAFNGIVVLALPLILHVYGLSDLASHYARQILLYHAVCAVSIWPLSFTLPNTLRASNDVSLTMFISILSMWVFRVGFSYLLGLYFHLELFGVWIAMTIDWLVRAICFVLRYRSGKWKKG